MPGTPASIYANRRRPLAEKLALASDAMPGGGNFYPEEDVLAVLAEEVLSRRPKEAVALGGGLGAVVIARAQAQAGRGRLTVLEHDGRRLQVTREMLARVGVDACLVEAELEPYDDHNHWYPRHRLGLLPEAIDFLFIDGPGHFAGRMPRWPAGPELFPRLSQEAMVVLDDGRRVKEKKALEQWAREFPDLKQTMTKTSGGAVILCRR